MDNTTITALTLSIRPSTTANDRTSSSALSQGETLGAHVHCYPLPCPIQSTRTGTQQQQLQLPRACQNDPRDNRLQQQWQSSAGCTEIAQWTNTRPIEKNFGIQVSRMTWLYTTGLGMSLRRYNTVNMPQRTITHITSSIPYYPISVSRRPPLSVRYILWYWQVAVIQRQYKLPRRWEEEEKMGYKVQWMKASLHDESSSSVSILCFSRKLSPSGIVFSKFAGTECFQLVFFPFFPRSSPF